MRTRKRWLLLTAALLGLGVPGRVVADPPGSSSVFTQMLKGTPPKPKPAPPPAKLPPKPVEDPVGKARNRELENWLRRTDVCNRLMQVAEDTNDEALRKHAEDLERRARETYERRIAELNGEPTDGQLLKNKNTSSKPAGLFSFFRGNDRDTAAPVKEKEGGSQ
ncbi:hypothetical protein AYO40_03050 [Planctomycetaceae bacterium SCGC AG-212-D15]|nr:hypothetical protein AYO40_03050 [Planctomycetaceae bacterium SCGC AG-212-D15]